VNLISYRTLAAISLVLLAIPQFALGVLEIPFVLVVGSIALALAALMLRFDRWWAIAPGVVGAAIATIHTFAFYHSYGRPDAALEFGYAWSTFVTGVAVVAFGIAALVAKARGSSGRAPSFATQGLAAATLAVVAAVVVSGVLTVAGRSTVSAEEREGAIELVYKDTDLETAALSADAGEPVRIVVDNKDMWFHDFEIEGEGVNVKLGPKESKLVELDLAPGTYDWRCTVNGHGNMKGTLTVE
jgi:plastocyanin